jgi:hypothetical protein
MAPAEARIGRSAVPGHRIRPDGYDLRWAQLGILDTIEDPELPFFVCWGCDPGQHPSAGAGQVAIAGMDIVGDAQRVSQWLGEPADHPLDGVDVTWIAPEAGAGRDELGLLAVEFDTPRGRVRID